MDLVTGIGVYVVSKSTSKEKTETKEVRIYDLAICPICRADLRYGRNSMIPEPTPAQLAEMLSAHYQYHNLQLLEANHDQ